MCSTAGATRTVGASANAGPAGLRGTHAGVLRPTGAAVKTAAIIVNYRTAEMTARATEALLRRAGVSATTTSTSSTTHSGDGSLEQLRARSRGARLGRRARACSPPPRNGGYGYGINLAVAAARSRATTRPDYVYVLNSDAFPDRGSLAAAGRVHGRAPGGRHRRQPRARPRRHEPGRGVSLSDASGASSRARPASARCRACSPRHVVSMPAPSEHREIDWIPGTSMLIRRERVRARRPVRRGLLPLLRGDRLLPPRAARRLERASTSRTRRSRTSACVSTGMVDARRPHAALLVRLAPPLLPQASRPRVHAACGRRMGHWLR